MKKSGGSILRMIFVAVAIGAQVGWLTLQVAALNEYSVYISVFSSLLAALVVLRLHSRDTTPAMKMPWIMVILVFPVMGLTLYFLMMICGDPAGTKKRLARVRRERPVGADGKAPWCRSLAARGYPAYEGTQAKYFADAAQAFRAMKDDLERAEHFIFMEYFIVEDGEAFREIEEILVRKSRQGVEVRLMYDDMGSIGVANFRFARRLRQAGIQCRVFNPAVPVLNLFMNHRDHRKITVIDGKVGYTGGFNLAGEYFGYRKPYGHWKDGGLRLEGPGVDGLTGTFLELWDLTTGKQTGEGYTNLSGPAGGGGWVLPYGDDPLGTERLTEDLYLNLAGCAREKLWFMTPYLILTDELTRALGLAAKRGVDVRIITPGIPDKKTVYSVTRSYYAGLARRGVRIFEYTPGFCHGKLCLADGETAVVGTSNLDFRSLYHHFENNVILHGCAAVGEVEEDFLQTFAVCREVTAQYADGPNVALGLWQCILRLLAPLM